MTVLIILSLITVTGVFFVYQIIVSENQKANQKNTDQVFLNGIAKGLSFRIPKIDFSFLSKSSKQESLKVEPITSLRDYYASKVDDTVVELDLTKNRIAALKSDPQISKNVIPAVSGEPPKSFTVSDKAYAILKEQFDALQADYKKAELLLRDRTLKLDQVQRTLETELRLRQQQDVDASKQQTKEFVSLPPDLIQEIKEPVADALELKKNMDKMIQPDLQKTDADYKMQSETDIVKRLTDKKSS